MPLLIRIGILLLLCQTVFSQNHYFKKYTVGDGMPQTETTIVFVDSEGYIWASCSNGWITKYDGLEFKNYSPEEIGMSNHSYKFFEDSNGVWAWDIRKKLSLFSKNKWTPIKTPESTCAIRLYPKWGLMALTEKGYIFNYSPNSNSWHFLSQLQIPTLERSDLIAFNFYTQSEKLIIYIRLENKKPEFWLLNDPEAGVASLYSNDKNILYVGHDFKYYLDDYGSLIFQKNGFPQKTIFQNTSFFHIAGYHPYEGFWAQATSSSSKKENIYWLDRNGSVFLKAIANKPIKSIAIDTTGHYWLASQSGLLRLNPWEQLFFDDQPEMIPNLHCIGEDEKGGIWMGGYRDGFVVYDNNQITPFITSGKDLRLLPGAFRSSTGEQFYWTENYGLIFIDNERNWRSLPLYNPIIGQSLTGYCFLPLSNGDLGLGTTRMGLGLLSPPFQTGENCRFVGKEKGLILDNVLCLEEDLNQRIWCGRSSQGVALYDTQLDTAFTWLIKDFPDPGIGAISMEIDSNNNLWLGTNKGLFFLKNPHHFDPLSDSLFNLIQSVDLTDAGMSNILALKTYKHWLIFSNALGHGFIDLKSYYSNPEKPRIIFTNTAQPERGGSGEQNAILIDKQERLWIGKDRGAICLDLKQLPLEYAGIKMDDPLIIAGGIPIKLSNSNIPLPLEKRSLKIVLQPILNGIYEQHPLFQYRLSGEGIPSPEFTELKKNREIYFDYLPPGIYLLEINMFLNNQLVYLKKLTIEVPGALTEKPFFWFALACLFVLIIGVGIHFRRRGDLLIRKAELEKAKWESRLQHTQISALTSSLNPHFINNSLNWLQYKVIKDPEAVAVVGRLSENIRTVFQHSRAGRPDHNLKEELRLVENYLLIQKVRYNQALNIKYPDLKANPDIGKIKVPLMQLLIHVENAIEHGIRNKKDSNHIEINAEINEDYLYLQVKDDGIGRLKAKEMPSHGTQQGTKMLKELHQILNQRNNLQIKSWYVDCPETDPITREKYGTIVNIRIPLIFDYGHSNA